MRLKCITALKALYEKRESAMKLGLFFHRFKVSLFTICHVAVVAASTHGVCGGLG